MNANASLFKMPKNKMFLWICVVVFVVIWFLSSFVDVTLGRATKEAYLNSHAHYLQLLFNDLKSNPDIENLFPDEKDCFSNKKVWGYIIGGRTGNRNDIFYLTAFNGKTVLCILWRNTRYGPLASVLMPDGQVQAVDVSSLDLKEENLISVLKR